MKDWYVMGRTYNCYGGQATLNLLSTFFLRDLPDYGPALQEITITLNFVHSGPPNRALGNSFENFHAGLRKLPKVVFRRSRESASIDIVSDLMTGNEFYSSREYSLSSFAKGARQVTDALELLRPRIRPTDRFDFESLFQTCVSRLRSIPSAQKQFEVLVERLKAWEKNRRDSESPWDRLGVDFRDFHPQAREILDDPFYWSSTDDFAPHGNDTGADLLSDYRSWVKKNPSSDPLEFYNRLLTSWGLEDDELVADQAAIALAFAELKIQGRASVAISSKALEATRRQLRYASALQDDPSANEWASALRRIHQKLQEAAQKQ